jgi:putative DNA primase/helicase
MTGDQPLTARFLRQEFFTFRPEFKIWLATNHKPQIRGTDDAIWDRIRLIPFDVRFWDEDVDGPASPGVPVADKTLEAKLMAELPGILTWAVRGCLEWQRDGLTLPREIREATQSYREEMDILGQFIAECCVVALSAEVLFKDLFATYLQWCEENNMSAASTKRFAERLKERGFQDRRDNTKERNRVYSGLALTEAARRATLTMAVSGHG